MKTEEIDSNISELNALTKLISAGEQAGISDLISDLREMEDALITLYHFGIITDEPEVVLRTHLLRTEDYERVITFLEIQEMSSYHLVALTVDEFKTEVGCDDDEIDDVE